MTILYNSTHWPLQLPSGKECGFWSHPLYCSRVHLKLGWGRDILCLVNSHCCPLLVVEDLFSSSTVISFYDSIDMPQLMNPKVFMKRILNITSNQTNSISNRFGDQLVSVWLTFCKLALECRVGLNNWIFQTFFLLRYGFVLMLSLDVKRNSTLHSKSNKIIVWKNIIIILFL